MTSETLQQKIDSHYNSRRDFIEVFNTASNGDYLDETTLSRQLSGTITISRGWGAAYALFFKPTEQLSK